MAPTNFTRFWFGLEGRKALNPTQSVSESVSYLEVGIELLGQLKMVFCLKVVIMGENIFSDLLVIFSIGPHWMI